MTIRRKVIPL
jgi:hypothetical protein